jgi:hypothetical protein
MDSGHAVCIPSAMGDCSQVVSLIPQVWKKGKQMPKRLLQIEVVLSGGQIANVSRSDSGEILVHIHFGHEGPERFDLNREAIATFIEAEKAVNR